MQITVPLPTTRRSGWIIAGVVLALVGAIVLFGHTGPKMMASEADGGASPFDLFGAWGPIIAAILALIKGFLARDPSEIVNAVKALAASPQSKELLRRAEVAFIDLIRRNYSKDTEVLTNLESLSVSLAKAKFHPETEPQGDE